MSTVIIADTCSDLPFEYVKQHNIPLIHFTYNFKGVEYADDLGQTISYRYFYNAMRDGEVPTTSQVNVQTYAEMFRKYAAEGKPVIYLCFSSALSGSYNNALLARDIVLEEYPEADITVIDTKSASLGEGLVVYYAVEMLERGASKEEIIDWVEQNKLKIHHWFTVEDLQYLKRGGRLSGTAAFIGNILDIKPVLHVDREGRLVPKLKVKGRKKSLRTLVDMMEEHIVDPEEQVVAISHCDSDKDAQYVAELIRSKFSVKDIIINQIGPVIGSHSGPGTLAVFFMGGER
ncbi:DegV family protein with EDD domain [Caldicoprobacter guelmensis]|uniref:DegV family protein n=1 Tax=Caldicoprobacter guelmensis TaxID=1170224 RepID=UPI0019589439|nr:DegV family protein [Caldicoprobacter guelmensis]MBM7581794.1 DegV family protein with EDD domain [Caldicoprobacter guelmensis]